jgi:radical SAM superfamily enzyme YgiQ (UPF0313 family)
MFGIDGDDENDFERMIEFLLRTKAGEAQMFIMTPFPGTEFYDSMEKAGRIITKKWQLFDGTHVVFKPQLMSEEKLAELYWQAHQKFYSIKNSFKRLMTYAKITPAYYTQLYSIILQYYIFWQKVNNRVHPTSDGFLDKKAKAIIAA